jgi:hypothetical protein
LEIQLNGFGRKNKLNNQFTLGPKAQTTLGT